MAILDLIIGLGYITFALVIVGLLGRRLYKWAMVSNMSRKLRIYIIASIFGSMAFLVGCAGTHFEMMSHYGQNADMAREMAPHMIAVGVPQVLGVWGPIWLLVLTSREFDKATKRKQKEKEQDGLESDE